MLVRGGAALGLAGGAVRVALVRLRQEGLIDSPRRGSYRLGPAAQPVHSRVSRWREVEQGLTEWRGEWLAVHTANLWRTDKAAVRARDRALRLVGFRELTDGLFLRPANLSSPLPELAAHLRELGLDGEAPVFRIAALEPEDEQAALALWDTDALAAGYRALLAQLDESAARLPDLPLAEAVAESFTLGREAIRSLVLDPRLPEPFVSARERRGGARSDAGLRRAGQGPVATLPDPRRHHRHDGATPMSTRWQDAFTPAEIRALRQQSLLQSAWSVLVDWGLIAGALALVAWLPHPVTVVLSLFVIGARQLGLAVLMHEASHRTLFANRRLNDWVGRWLCAYPVFLSLDLYRPYHLQHHAHTWTERDPDLSLATGWPVSPASFARKVARDLLGITGIKRLVFSLGLVGGGLVGRKARGAQSGTPGTDAKAARRTALRTITGFLLTNAALFGVLAALGHPALYLLWAGAWLTTSNLVTRIRAIAEHALVPDPSTPLGQTRTVEAGPLARLFVAPNFVQFHLEHHLLMTVPHYNLPRLHRLLRERGLLDGACVSRGYLRVLGAAMGRASAAPS